ncbi:hypothetical protein ACFOYW_09930 [Gryllotalpicola reticulitermitis]|uniref:Uncharacterized protein n=1 Tax=Gryllotalpicola reticulitermitis TaxID=1184153 RepID=A0ABV8Q6P7_9MICO
MTATDLLTGRGTRLEVRAHDGKPLQLLVRPSAVRLPDNAPRRERPRPVELRDADYDKKFDFDTMFYDVFRSGDDVIAIGPPLLNLRDPAAQWRYDADGATVPLPRFITMHGNQRAVFRRFAGRELGITAPGSVPVVAEVGADLAPYFSGTRAVTTVQLDNKLEWISDWVRWHHRSQGTDAVVVYDNGSTHYSLDELLDAISLPGVRVAAVIDWPFRYGPQGSDVLPWDSAFAQAGAIEHARRRVLRLAAGMLSIDIDEMVHPINGRDVYQLAAESAFGMARFHGTWAYANPAAPPAAPVHTDCRWVHPLDEPTERKWCAVPRRIPERAQLIVHSGRGVPAPPSWSSGFWHMRPISTSWKVDRAGFDRPRDTYALEPSLDEQLRTYLGSDLGAAPGRRPSPWPVVLLRRAVDLAGYAWFHSRDYVHRFRATHR